MPTMQPEQATFFLQVVGLPALQNEHPVTKRVIEAIPLDKGDYRPEPVAKSALELAWHIVAAEQRFLSGEELLKPIDFRGMFQFPAVQYILFSNNHSIHHRGQLSVYLRPMGGKVPAIYGESYDSAEARKAAQA